MSTEEEEKYFKQQEMERREAKRRELEQAAREAAEQRKIGETLNTDDDSILAQVRALGFDGDSARILDLLPLIHVAWADGSVSARERAAIMQVLEARNIARDSEAFLIVESLLEKRPSDAFLDETLEILRAIGGGQGTSIVELSLQVASASGGFFGLTSSVSAEERELMERIAKGLGDEAVSALQARLK